MPSVFIDGGAGTTGLEISERLAGRAAFNILKLDEDCRKDKAARRDALNSTEFVLLCLPDDAAREAVALIDSPGTRVIDASSAHRVNPDWAYGFPEFAHRQREKIAQAKCVSNPGCYPTGFIGLLAPLVRGGLLPAGWPYSVHAASGYSGGGRAMIERFETDPAIALKAYGFGDAHKHLAEMRQYTGIVEEPLFAPFVVPAFRGMMLEIPLPLDAMGKAASAREIAEALANHYQNEPLVRVHENPHDDELLLRGDAPPGDRLDLYCFTGAQGARMRLVAMLDNLGKGASGAAVQNLNIMAGLPETEGLLL